MNGRSAKDLRVTINGETISKSDKIKCKEKKEVLGESQGPFYVGGCYAGKAKRAMPPPRVSGLGATGVLVTVISINPYMVARTDPAQHVAGTNPG